MTLMLRASVDELHDNPQGRAQKQHIQRLKEAAEKQVRPFVANFTTQNPFCLFFSQVCTFKPDTTASQSGITEGDTVSYFN